MTDCGRHSADEKAWLDFLVASNDAALSGYVVDFACQDCGRVVTVEADWDTKPVCCGWSMVDSPGTVRRS